MSDSSNPFPKRLPDISRAVDDSEDSDWDEAAAEEAEGAPPSLASSIPGGGNCALRLGAEARQEMSSSSCGRLECSTLLVGVGPAACAFLRACVLGDEARILGLICCGFPDGGGGGGLANSLGQTALGDFACFLYRMECNPQVVVCQSMSPVPPADCHAFVAALMSLFDLDNLDAGIFATQSLATYQSDQPTSELPRPLLRCLRSSAMVSRKGKSSGPVADVPLLEAPNLMTGVAAELLSVCQMRRVPAAAFVSYDASDGRGDSRSPDGVAAFRPALLAEPLRLCRAAWPRDSDSVIERLCRAGNAASAAGSASSASASSLYT